jgi:hypothetical protein
MNPFVSSISSALATYAIGIFATWMFRFGVSALASFSVKPTRPSCGSMNTV